jgi:hypothetical protein
MVTDGISLNFVSQACITARKEILSMSYIFYKNYISQEKNTDIMQVIIIKTKKGFRPLKFGTVYYGV